MVEREIEVAIRPHKVNTCEAFSPYGFKYLRNFGTIRGFSSEQVAFSYLAPHSPFIARNYVSNSENEKNKIGLNN